MGEEYVQYIQEDPCESKSGVVADAKYCDRYFECVKGKAVNLDCPNGLVFAGKNKGVLNGCNYPERAEYCVGKQRANGPISTGHCQWLFGLFEHDTSCIKYYTCWNGTEMMLSCPGGLLFNDVAKMCDWPEHVTGCQQHRKFYKFCMGLLYFIIEWLILIM